MDIFLYISTIPITIFLMVYLKPGSFYYYIQGVKDKQLSWQEVVYGTGLAFLIPCILSVLPLWEKIGKDNFIVYLVMLLSMTLMGYLDDSLGIAPGRVLKTILVASCQDI